MSPGNKSHLTPAAFLAAAAFFVSATSTAGAPPPGGWGPVNGMSIGPTAAVTLAETNGFTPGLEISYFHKINIPLFWWLTAGTRLTIADGNTVTTPYLETGLNFLVFVVGGGWGPAIGDGAVSHSVNGFVGLAIPIFTPKRGHLFFLESYWRPIWFPAEAAAPMAHELGVGIKWMFTITPKPGRAAPGPG